MGHRRHRRSGTGLRRVQDHQYLESYSDGIRRIQGDQNEGYLCLCTEGAYPISSRETSGRCNWQTYHLLEDIFHGIVNVR